MHGQFGLCARLVWGNLDLTKKVPGHERKAVRALNGKTVPGGE
jgi:hypothetical protein